MKKKIAIVLTSLLILTAMLTTAYFTPLATAQDNYHWKIVLASQNCSAKIVGYLTYETVPIPGTEFNLTCDVDDGFVFWKVNTSEVPTDIEFEKWIDDVPQTPVVGYLEEPTTEPHVWYEDVETEDDKMVVVEVHDTELSHEWQLTVLAQNSTYGASVKVNFTAFLTRDGVSVSRSVTTQYCKDAWSGDGSRKSFMTTLKPVVADSEVVYVDGTLKKKPADYTMNYTTGNITFTTAPGIGANIEAIYTVFGIRVGPDYKPPEPPPLNYHHHRSYACDVVKTPECVIPNDINYTLQVDWEDDGVWDINENVHESITQFPWTRNETGPEGETVELELTEVQMHRYILMEGETNAYGQLGTSPPWLDVDWSCPACDRLWQVVWTLENTTVFDATSPVCGYWNGSDPLKIKGNIYHLSDWTDADGSGDLSHGDWVEISNATHEIWSLVDELEYGAISNLTIAEPYFDPFTGQQLPGMGVPVATRPPDLTPLTTEKYLQGTYGQNITFTQKDPITGVVKLGIPAESYVGLDHPYYSPRLNTYFRVQIFTEDQGCGYLFTGEGKNPIFGDVDIITYGTSTGTYSNKTDELMTMRTCLQGLKGDDGIPGTADDPFGDGATDPSGSAIMLIPSTQLVTYWADGWKLLFASPWPQPFTTGVASSIVIDAGSSPNNELGLRHANHTVQGKPMEFLAGIDHAGDGYDVSWKHPYCNAYITSVCAWSIINTQTVLGVLDVMFWSVQKAYRDDALIADINCDEKVSIKDIGRVAVAFGGQDEADFGTDGTPLTADDTIPASPNYDGGADLMKPEGKINIKDIGRIAIDFGAKLTPDGIIRPS